MISKTHQQMLRGALGGALLWSCGAHATSYMNLYGVFDTGIEYVSHASTSGGLFRVPSLTGEVPSRWGMRGVEDLGGNLSAVFTLESGFNPNNGTLGQGGRLFGRQAFVGLQSDYGLVSFGRQYNMTTWALADANVLGPNIYSISSLDPYLAVARSDNTVAYKGTFRGLTVGATYSFGRDAGGTGNTPGQGTCFGSIPGHTSTCSQWTAMLKYDAAHFGLAFAYDVQHGGPGAAVSYFDGTPSTPLTGEMDKDVHTTVNGYATWGALKIGGGWIGRYVTTEGGAPEGRYDMFFANASYTFTPAFQVDGQLVRIVNTHQNTRATLAVLRGTYSLSKRTAVYLQSGYLINSAHASYTVSVGGGGTTPPQGATQLGVMAGMKTSF
ncbi:porin [Pandoraea aquatica]|uniref:Porin n=1 Tax=Pandoraea aquatica TaxID=2508290 RepID=A0A5E4VRF1_9BURK|nr:porin [Pandoraea aquatica]VVE15027.1 porin [Pandoraea aquatica]